MTPAIATIENLRTAFPAWKVVFVGRKVAIEGSRTLSEEYRLIRALRIPFLSLTAGKLKRDGGIGALASFVKVPLGFVQALWYVYTRKPRVIVSFGGYIALPVVVAGWLMRVPVITHEQTRMPGLANKIISRFSKYTCTSYPDMESSHGLSGKIVYTGLPMRKSIFTSAAEPSFPYVKHARPLLLIVGGSTGAVRINEVVYDALPALLRDYTVIHQVGRISWPKASDMKKQLKKNHEHYLPAAFLSETDYAWSLQHADCIIGRSGANTVMEIATVGNIAVFIPLPQSGENEQYHNALFLQKAGSAILLQQEQLSPDSLLRSVAKMIKERTMRMAAANRIAAEVPRDAASRFVSLIQELAETSRS